MTRNCIGDSPTNKMYAITEIHISTGLYIFRILYVFKITYHNVPVYIWTNSCTAATVSYCIIVTRSIEYHGTYNKIYCILHVQAQPLLLHCIIIELLSLTTVTSASTYTTVLWRNLLYPGMEPVLTTVMVDHRRQDCHSQCTLSCNYIFK